MRNIRLRSARIRILNQCFPMDSCTSSVDKQGTVIVSQGDISPVNVEGRPTYSTQRSTRGGESTVSGRLAEAEWSGQCGTHVEGVVESVEGCLIAVKGCVSAWDDPAGCKVVSAVGRRRRMMARSHAGRANVGNAVVEQDAATLTTASPAASPRQGRPCRRSPARRGYQRASAAGSG